MKPIIADYFVLFDSFLLQSFNKNFAKVSNLLRYAKKSGG